MWKYGLKLEPCHHAIAYNFEQSLKPFRKKEHDAYFVLLREEGFLYSPFQLCLFVRAYKKKRLPCNILEFSEYISLKLKEEGSTVLFA